MFWAEKTMHEKDAQEQYDPTSLKEFEKAKCFGFVSLTDLSRSLAFFTSL
jgi:hypothetical protein